MQVTGAHTEHVEGSRQEMIAKDKESKIGGEHELEVKGHVALTVSKEQTDKIGNKLQLEVKAPAVWMAKTFELKTDKLIIAVNDMVALCIDKSGNVGLYGKTITLDGAQIKFNAGKIKKEAAGSPPSFKQIEALRLAASNGSAFCEECQKKFQSKP